MAKRTARDNRDLPHPKPVQRVELSDQHVGLRIFLVVILVLIAGSSLAYAVSSWLTVDSGWTTISPDSAADIMESASFELQYELGTTDLGTTAENKAIVLIYTDALELACQSFQADVEYEDVHNIYYINRHVNEDIVVEPVLYQAFEQMKDQLSYLYLGPLYAEYYAVFASNDDQEAAVYDPELNEDQEVYFEQVCSFISNGAIELVLLGDYTVRLEISEEYEAFADEYGLTSYLDFFWMKNAFIVDYVAEQLVAGGYTNGQISSVDGYVRCLDERQVTYGINLIDDQESGALQAAAFSYEGPMSVVMMKNFPVYSTDDVSYYTYGNGETRYSYLSPDTGRCTSALPGLLCYSADVSSAEIMLEMMPVYISSEFGEESLEFLWEMAGQGIYSIYCQNQVIYYSEEGLSLEDVYDGESVSYKTERMPSDFD
ncbi:MAG: hypothetical protein LUH19_02735 [Lachnospiraceae bacterium]|nr:hypothetical protein [Lachnospiraceae bacterium]